MNAHPVLDRGGVEGEIIWHLTEIEKGLLKKVVLLSEYVGIKLTKIRVTWRQNKQGKEKNKAEKDLSLNKLPTFQENRGLLTETGLPMGSVQQHGVMLAGTWPLLPYDRHVQWEGN